MAPASTPRKQQPATAGAEEPSCEPESRSQADRESRLSTRGTELLGLVERLERALDRAPEIISIIESGTARIETQQAHLSQRFERIEQTCTCADEVQRGLADFADRLFDAGEAAHDKLSLLVEALESGDRLRRSLEVSERRITEQLTSLADLDNTAANRREEIERSWSRRMSDLAETHLEELAKTHRARTSEMERLSEDIARATDRCLATLKQTRDAGVAELNERAARSLDLFDENGEHGARIKKTVEQAVAAIDEAAERQAAQCSEVVKQAVSRLDALSNECQGRLNEQSHGYCASIANAQRAAETHLSRQVEQLAGLYGPDGEHARSIAESAENALGLINQAEQESRKRVNATVDQEISRFQALTDEIDRRLAPFAEGGERIVRINETVEQAVAAVDEAAGRQAARWNETVEQAVTRISALSKECQGGLNEQTRGCRASIEDAQQAAETRLSRQVDQLAGLYGPDGEHARSIAESAENALGLINQAEQESRKRVNATVDQEISRFQALTDEIDRRLAPFAEGGERIVRINETVEQAVARIGAAADQQATQWGEFTEQELSRITALGRECESRLNERLHDCATSIAKARQAADAHLSQNMDQLAALYGPEGEHARQLAASTQDALERVAQARENSLKHLTALTAEEASKLRVVADTSLKRLASQTQASRAAVRMVADATNDAHTVLQSLGERQDTVQALNRELDERTDSAKTTISELTPLHSQAEQAVARLRETVEGSQTAVEKTEALIQEVRFAAATGQQHVDELANASTQAERVREGLSNAIEAAGTRAQQLEQADDRIAGTIESSQSTIERTQSAAEALAQVIDRAGQARANVNAAAVNAGGAGDRLTAQTEAASELVCDLGGLVEQAERATERMEAARRLTSKLTADAVQLTQRAERANDTLTGSLANAEMTLTNLEEATNGADAAAAHASDARNSVTEAIGELEPRIATHQQLADAMTAQLAQGRDLAAELSRLVPEGTSLQDATRRLDDELRAHIESGDNTAKQLGRLVAECAVLAEQGTALTNKLNARIETGDDLAKDIADATSAAVELKQEQVSLRDVLGRYLDQGTDLAASLGKCVQDGTDLKDELAANVRDAQDAGRKIGDLLPAIAQQREYLETADHLFNDFVEHIQELKGKWQRLETRAESLGHQLNAMLAEPARIVQDARAQADNLEQVCTIVRKLFSGLSQTSLQANRDITRFSDVSRQANDKLVRITAETQRASQTLREWIEEASHVRSRLARALGQVPAIERTHPPAALEKLDKIAMESLPGTLTPGSVPPPRPPERREQEGGTAPEAERRSGLAKVDRLAQDAEQVVQGKP